MIALVIFLAACAPATAFVQSPVVSTSTPPGAEASAPPTTAPTEAPDVALSATSETAPITYVTQMKNGPIMLYDNQISLHGGPNSIPVEIQAKQGLAIAQQLGLLSHTTNMADYPTQGSRISSVPNSVLIQLFDRIYPKDQRTKEFFDPFVQQFNSDKSVTIEVQVPNNAIDPNTTYTTLEVNPAKGGYKEDLVDWIDLDPQKDPSIMEFSSPLPIRIKYITDGNTIHAVVTTSLTKLTEQQKDVLTFSPFYMALILDKLPILKANSQRNSLANVPSSAGPTDIMLVSSILSSDKAVPAFIEFGK